MARPASIMSMRLEDLIDTERFEFEALSDPTGGRMEVWARPNPSHRYVIGADFALGLEGRDYDAGSVFDLDTTPISQVAEVHGHWGQSFDRILYALGIFYGCAFILGEAQFGVACLQRLYTEFEYPWLYWNRDEGYRSRPVTDKLGYYRGAGDVHLPNFRRAVRDHLLILRSRPTLAQMGKLQYRPKNKSMMPEEAGDKDLDIKLAGGGSPDLVMASVYAWAAVSEVGRFDLPPPKYLPGTMGAILGHEEMDEDEDAPQPLQRRRRRG